MFRETDFSTRHQMLPKSKIRLSRHLHAQTTPYPEARAWLKRSLLLLVIVIGVGIFLLAKPKNHPPAAPRQILGEQQSGELKYATYEVKKGDTLFNLAARFSVSWQTLAQMNELKEPYTLKIGQKIKIPR